MKNKWDKKAQHYGRYSPEGDGLEGIVLALLEQMGVEFEGKNVLDIGCGTGVYTLHIAQLAKRVDAIDISGEMLRILEDDAFRYKIDNIHTYTSNWDEFILPHTRYDYAISTMSPATREQAGFEKMHRSAHTKIFLGWGDKRGTELLEELFDIHGQIYTPPNGAVKLRAWLEDKHIEYTLKEHIETKTRKRTMVEAIQRYAWHLQARDMTPDRDKIRSLLQMYLDADRNVVERVKNYFNLIVWR
jgi:SAM-dependent methyltransferase